MSSLGYLLYNKAYRHRNEINDMDVITYSAARADLLNTMNRVYDDHDPLVITRNGKQSVVMLSLEDYKALEETAYLLRSPMNAKRLLSALSQFNAGKGVTKKMTK